MSIPRLPFLYPHLFKQTILHETSHAPFRVRQVQVQKAGIKTSKCLKQETYAQRYGTAAEPPPPPPSSSMPSKPQDEKNSLASAIEQEVKSPPKAEEQKKISPPPSPGKEASKASPPTPPKISDGDISDSSRDDAITATMRDPATRARELAAAAESQTAEKSADAAARNTENSGKAKPLETVLKTDPPPPAEEKKPEEHEAVHLQAPPYVHHFDSYSLVKDLQNAAFSEDQSVTIMKAVRGLLATNLDVAKEGLVSKSDVENETYLFLAACSELRTEILNARKASSTKTRTLLSHLQHTTDILSQRTSQETLSLRDDLRGMLNDRRMETRMQTQIRDSEISELNYRISVRLGSDAKSEVEGLRWVLTRRAAMAIAGMAGLILGSLRYGSWKMHQREVREREGRGRESGGGGGGGGKGHTVASREMGTQTGESGGAGGMDKAENVGYVSLG